MQATYNGLELPQSWKPGEIAVICVQNTPVLHCQRS
jgi:hypothetical protein